MVSLQWLEPFDACQWLVVSAFVEFLQMLFLKLISSLLRFIRLCSEVDLCVEQRSVSGVPPWH